MRGTITVGGKDIAVTGQAWFDHEWSSQPLAADQTGWDWFSFHFATGEKLMGFRLRDAGEGFTSATWINADGRPEPQPPGALDGDAARLAGREGPSRAGAVESVAPGEGARCHDRAAQREAWMDTQVSYWEGPVRIAGTHPGRGYVEMTGY